MTIFVLLLVGAMGAAYVVAEVLGKRMQSELRRGFPPTRKNGSNKDAVQGMAVEETAALEPGDFGTVAKPPDVAAVMVGASGPPVRQRLGYPAVLEPLYEGIRTLPGSGWDFEIEAVGVEKFDSPEELLSIAETLPLMEVPIFALINARRLYPDKFKVLKKNFSAGTVGHPPFRFVGRREAGNPSSIDVADLYGKAVAVIGQCMSPTAALSSALRDLGVKTRLWQTHDWFERHPDRRCLDLLVSESIDGQHHALKTKQVDWALVIYPYTHDPYGSRFSDSAVENIEIKSLEGRMGELLASETLNVFVTHNDWYSSHPQWRLAVDGLVEKVSWRNRQMDEDNTNLIHAASGSVEEALVSGEVEFNVAGEVLSKEELDRFELVGASAGLWPDAISDEELGATP